MLTHLNPMRELDLERELSFETLLAEISSRFVNIPAQQVDREFEDSLRRICGLLDVDESTIFLRDGEDPDTYVLTYILRDPELLDPPKTKFTATEYFPWCNRKLIANEIVCVPDIEALPDEAAVDKAMWRKYHIYSALAIPLSTGGRQPEGFWGIDSTSRKRDWPEPLQKAPETDCGCICERTRKGRSRSAVTGARTTLKAGGEYSRRRLLDDRSPDHPHLDNIEAERTLRAGPRQAYRHSTFPQNCSPGRSRASEPGNRIDVTGPRGNG